MIPNNNESIDLTKFDDDFASAEVEEKEFEDVPDGKYQVKVDRVEMTNSKTSGSPMLKWSLKILGPTHTGRVIFRNNVISSRENIKWLKKDLHTCGLELKKLSDLPYKLDYLLDVTIEVNKLTKNEFSTIYLNRRIIVDDKHQPLSDIPF